MEGINSFEKGLHRSNSPQEQPEGSYVDALNWIRNDSGRLINEELEELVQTLPNYILVGYTPINDEFICFFQVGTNSEIGIFNKNKSPNYTPVFNDINHPSYKLNFGSSIDCVARIVSLATNPATSGDLVVYFVEENNPMRRFNISEYISKPNIYNTIEDFNLLLEYKMPYCALDIIQDGGGLSSGVYSIVLRYRTTENNKTICNIPTKFLSIIDENPANLSSYNRTGQYSDFFDGCPPGTATTKSIKITTKHVDENYPYIEPIIITYTGIANNLVIKSLGIYANKENNEILFSSLQQLRDDVPTTEISENAFFYESAECIEQKDNVLVLSNLTSKKYDDTFQKVANDIELYWEIEKYSLNSTRFINSYQIKTGNPSQDWEYTTKNPNNSITRGGLPTGEFYRYVTDATDYWNTNIYQEPTTKKGFQRGEVYSFSITPIYKDGSLGFAYHIPGKPADTTKPKRLKAWLSSNKYPDYMKKYGINNTDQIQHHQMPDFEETPRLGGHNFKSDNIYNGSDINVLRVKATNIDLTKYNLKDSIQGYIIGYQQRNSDVNTRIIDYGFVRPYLQAVEGAPQYRNGMFSGSAYYSTEGFHWSSTAAIERFSPYYMYHSADTTFLGREIKSSYKIEKIGYAINGVPNYNTNDGVGVKSYLTQNLGLGMVDVNGTLFYPDDFNDFIWIRELFTASNVSNTSLTPDRTINTTNNTRPIYSFTSIPVNNSKYVAAQYVLYVKTMASRYALVDVKTVPIVTLGLKDISVVTTNEFRRLFFTSTTSDDFGYEGSGTDVIVYEGTSRLNYDAVGTSNGTWRISSVTSSKITIPAPSIELDTASGKNFARYGDFSNMTTANGTVNFININITGKKTDGTAFTKTTTLSRLHSLKNQATTLVLPKYFPANDVINYNLQIYKTVSGTNEDPNIIVYQDGTNAVFIPQIYKSRLPLLIYKSVTNAGNAAGFLFFEEGNFKLNKSTAQNIVNTQLVPNVYDSQGVTRIGADITLNQCAQYWHITIPDGVGLINDDDLTFGDFRSPQQFYYTQVENDSGNQDFFEIERNININLAIARIINPVNFQYGPLSSAEYAPLLTRFDDENLDVLGSNSLTLEGDTYICKTFMRRYDNFKSNGNNSGSNNTPQSFQAQMLIGFYCESRNNLALRYKEVDGAEYYPKNRDIISNDPNNLGIMNRELHTITFPYNKQYSAVNNVKVSVTIPDFFKEVTKFPNRSIYSYTALESDIVDRYRIFPPIQFHDIPKDRGEIKDTFVFNNTFFHHTEYGLWQSFFNPNTIQSTSQGEVVLGNSGIFKIPSKLILDIKGGYMGTNDKSGTNTPFGRVFLDHYQGKVFLFAGEAPVEISDLGLFSFFREFVNTTDKYSMGYNWANKRLLISNITQEKAISFYPKTQTWTSLHDFAPTAYLTLNGSSYAWQDTGTSFYNLSNSNDRRKNSYITFVENTQPDAFKRFDRIEMNTMSGGSGGIVNPGSIPDATNYTFNNNSFTHIHTWTDRQNSTELVFAYSNDYNTNFLNSYDPSKVPVNYYRSSFHAEFPLDAVIDPYKNIFDDRLLPQGNLDINADFRTHMKGKFLYTKLSYKDNKPLVLNYVKTFFKPTVA